MTSKDLAIVLVSGGMDSVACAAVASSKHKELAFLHVQYGQNTDKKEKECFDKISDFYKLPHSNRLTVNLESLQKIGGSSLTDQNIEVSKFEGDSDVIPSSYVPFRNAHILSSAVSWAEVINANTIYIGANFEDSPGYPDCRPEYYEAFNHLIKVGTKEQNIHVETPVISMNKTEIIELANSLKAPLELSWSCYAQNDVACGVCDSCALRLRAFKKLGLEDPIKYTIQL